MKNKLLSFALFIISFPATAQSSATGGLHIQGPVHFTGLSENNTDSKILVSDQDGKIFWRDAPILGLPFTNDNTNLGVGNGTLINNTTGVVNSAYGYQSLYTNTLGNNNSAFGYLSLYKNTAGDLNSAFGDGSLHENTTGDRNSAFGSMCLFHNTTGVDNTAIGRGSLSYNTSGNQNTAVGYYAGMGYNQIYNNSTALGAYARITANNQVRLGNSGVTSIGGQVSWSTLSDGRFKNDIKEDVSGLDFISQLRPISYTVDKDGLQKFLGIPDSLIQQQSLGRMAPVRQTGFVAQEVEAIIKKTGATFSCVEAPQNEHDHYSIRYAEFVVPLVKAVQELNAMVKEQQEKIDALQKLIETHGIESTADGIEQSYLKLHQNAPNPFQVNTTIMMEIPDNIQHALLYFYDLQGKQVKKYAVPGRGNTSISIEGGDLAAGIYLYTLVADGNATETKRMLLTE